jgi:hypothetical protein
MNHQCQNPGMVENCCDRFSNIDKLNSIFDEKQVIISDGQELISALN